LDALLVEDDPAVDAGKLKAETEAAPEQRATRMRMVHSGREQSMGA
jgi:hypothetical protein